jgi:SAM-dependent methyltransferase
VVAGRLAGEIADLKTGRGPRPPATGRRTGRHPHPAAGRIRLHYGDGTSLPAAEHSLDAVIGVHTIYFWPDPAATLGDIARAARPGGRLLLA